MKMNIVFPLVAFWAPEELAGCRLVAAAVLVGICALHVPAMHVFRKVLRDEKLRASVGRAFAFLGATFLITRGRAILIIAKDLMCIVSVKES